MGALRRSLAAEDGFALLEHGAAALAGVGALAGPQCGGVGEGRRAMLEKRQPIFRGE